MRFDNLLESVRPVSGCAKSPSDPNKPVLETGCFVCPLKKCIIPAEKACNGTKKSQDFVLNKRKEEMIRLLEMGVKPEVIVMMIPVGDTEVYKWIRKYKNGR